MEFSWRSTYYPIMPMEISFLSLAWRVENCRRRLIKDPFPKDLLMEAWNARQGCSFDSNRTQAAYLPLVRGKYQPAIKAITKKERKKCMNQY